MALTHLEITMWQTTGSRGTNWNDFPPHLLTDVELNYRTWLMHDQHPSLAQFAYNYGPTNVKYVIRFGRMEQQRQGFGPDDPPRPLRRFPLTQVHAETVMWQTTGSCETNWNDFPPYLLQDVELNYRTWLAHDQHPSLAQFAYNYGPTNVKYVIDFDRMEQQRHGFGPNDPPRPLRRFPVFACLDRTRDDGPF